MKHIFCYGKRVIIKVYRFICKEELQNRVEVIRALTRRVRVVEAREKDLQTELRTTQQQLQQLGQEHKDMQQTTQDLQVQQDGPVYIIQLIIPYIVDILEKDV